MYIGRILALGITYNGSFVAYRVSSRSFPNRVAKVHENRVAILPTKGNEEDIYKNPYISYNCIRIVDDVAIVSNGSHTDVIADKIMLGMNIKDALSYSLITMDYEKDDYHTPRIAGVVGNDEAYISIISDDSLYVKKIPQDKPYYIATYDKITPSSIEFYPNSAKEAAQFIMGEGGFKNFSNPITAAAAFKTDKWSVDSI